MFLTSSTTWADYKEGWKAYDREDYTTALQEWTAAAKQGDPKAQNNLGLLYDNGTGVKQDHQKATFWYRKSAKQGNSVGQFKIQFS